MWEGSWTENRGVAECAAREAVTMRPPTGTTPYGIQRPLKHQCRTEGKTVVLCHAVTLTWEWWMCRRLFGFIEREHVRAAAEVAGGTGGIDWGCRQRSSRAHASPTPPPLKNTPQRLDPLQADSNMFLFRLKWTQIKSNLLCTHFPKSISPGHKWKGLKPLSHPSPWNFPPNSLPLQPLLVLIS